MARVSRTRPRLTTRLSPPDGGKAPERQACGGLTQQQLAEGRYTKAYVSALENASAGVDGCPQSLLRNGWASDSGSINDGRPWARSRPTWPWPAAAGKTPLRPNDELLGATSAAGRGRAVERQGERWCGAAVARAASTASEARLSSTPGSRARAAWPNTGSRSPVPAENTVEAKALLHSILVRVRAGLKVSGLPPSSVDGDLEQ